jgi:hypothetical protein
MERWQLQTLALLVLIAVTLILLAMALLNGRGGRSSASGDGASVTIIGRYGPGFHPARKAGVVTRDIVSVLEQRQGPTIKRVSLIGGIIAGFLIAQQLPISTAGAQATGELGNNDDFSVLHISLKFTGCHDVLSPNLPPVHKGSTKAQPSAP